MSTQQDIQTIEISIGKAKRAIELNKALNRLDKNKDFQLVIQEAYFKDEAARLIAAKSNPGLSMPEQQAHLDHCIMGLGSLQQFFITISQIAMQMEKTMADDEITHTELLQEDAA